MGLHQVIPFIPKTNHVNEDRRYFVDGSDFIKWDRELGRGRHEADMLEYLADAWYAPTIKATWVKAEGGETLIASPNFVLKESNPTYHCIRMTRVPGETIENLAGSLNTAEKLSISRQLLRIVTDLMDRGIVHGDINVSNTLFDRGIGKVYLIDYETAILESSTRDIHGPEWGLIDLLKRLK